MLQGVFIHLHPALFRRVGVSERTVADEVRRTLWRDDMQNVVGNGGPLLCGIAFELEYCLLLFRANLDEFLLEARVDAVACNNLIQYRSVLLDTVDGGCGAAVNYVYIFQDALPTKVIGSQIHDLLWGTRAFDGVVRHVEQSGATLKVSDQVPGPGGEIVGVVAGSIATLNRIGQAGNGVPIELNARCHYEEVVSNAST